MSHSWWRSKNPPSCFPMWTEHRDSPCRAWPACGCSRPPGCHRWSLREEWAWGPGPARRGWRCGCELPAATIISRGLAPGQADMDHTHTMCMHTQWTHMQTHSTDLLLYADAHTYSASAENRAPLESSCVRLDWFLSGKLPQACLSPVSGAPWDPSLQLSGHRITDSKAFSKQHTPQSLCL